MATRSDIIVEMSNGKFARIYCHWKGYLDHNGRILQGHYNSQERAEALIALGDLSSLGEEIGEKHPFDPPPAIKLDGSFEENPEYTEYKKKYGKWCKAYGRDRGEKNTEAQIFDTIYEAWPDPETMTEFTYVWTQGRWWVGDADQGIQSLVSLADALAGKTSVTPDIKVPFVGTVGKHAPLPKSN